MILLRSGSILLIQASVFPPAMFIAQEPQMPVWERKNKALDIYPLILLEEDPLGPKHALGLSSRKSVRDKENARSCHWAKHVAI